MKNMKIFILLILVVFIKTNYGQNPSYHVVVTDIKPSLVSNDHTSEGFMVTLNSGRIVHFFRFDAGYNGHHIGNAGKIVKRYTDDGGLTWSPMKVVFEDNYDDRNINGGLVGNDRIVLTFRRFDAVSLQQIDLNLIFSDDGGETWSNRQIINSIGVCSDTHRLINVPGKGYLNVFSNNNYIEIRFSNNGITWNDIAYVWDYRATQQYKLNESCFAYSKDGKIFGLMRNETYSVGGNYYQVVSGDSGKTWTSPVSTNMANGYFSPSPCILYDNIHDDLIAIATDRRGGNVLNQDNLNSQIWIYSNKVEDVFSDPLNWKLLKAFKRPQPSAYRLYGYATYAKKKDGNYLVVFSEASLKLNNKENADFYQFEIKYVDTPAPIASNHSACINDVDIELTASGSNLKWYSDSSLTNLLFAGSVFKPTFVASGEFKYYVTQTDSVYGFESPFTIVNVKINDVPNAIVGENVSICHGDEIPEIKVLGDNVQWYSNSALTLLLDEGNTFKPFESVEGSYSYYAVQSKDFCVSEPVEIRLIINPKPIIAINYESITINIGESVVLEAYNALNYIWEPPLNLNTTYGQSVIATPIESQTYTVTGIDVNGCSSSLLVKVNIDSISAFHNEENKESKFNIFPNPSTGVFNIVKTNSFDDQSYIVNIFDANGQIITSRVFDQNIKSNLFETIDLRSYSEGLYMIQILFDEGVIVKNVLISHN